MVEIIKPILHTGLLQYDTGNINYNEAFLKKIAESKDVKIELNKHKGKEIAKASELYYENGKLFAKMDIPEEYLADEIAFSTHIVPQKFKNLDEKTFDLEEGELKAIVYVNDGTEVRDVKTITNLYNLQDKNKGENKMVEETQLAKDYGALKTRYETLEEKYNTVVSDLQTANDKITQLETEKGILETDLETANSSLKVYLDRDEETKSELLKKIVEDNKDPLYEVYKDMPLDKLQLVISSKEGEDEGVTGTKGAGTKIVEQRSGQKPESKAYNYKEAKESMGIK